MLCPIPTAVSSSGGMGCSCSPRMSLLLPCHVNFPSGHAVPTLYNSSLIIIPITKSDLDYSQKMCINLRYNSVYGGGRLLINPKICIEKHVLAH